jgi:hypothetical protein
MDLLARKLFLNKGQSFKNLIDEIQKTIDNAAGMENLKGLASNLDKALGKLKEVAQNIGETLRSENMMNAFANATPFLDVTGDVVMAWMHLWRAVVAIEKLDQKPRKKDLEFYNGLLKSAQFFINTILPVSRGKMDVIIANDTTVNDISEAAFGGK